MYTPLPKKQCIMSKWPTQSNNGNKKANVYIKLLLCDQPRFKEEQMGKVSWISVRVVNV